MGVEAKIPEEFFSKHDVRSRRKLAGSAIRARIASTKEAYISPDDRWVCWRCGAMPRTMGRQPERAGREDR